MGRRSLAVIWRRLGVRVVRDGVTPTRHSSSTSERWARLEVEVGTAWAAEELARRGRRVPALVLHGALAGASPDAPDDRTLDDVRARLAARLRSELGVELAWVGALARYLRRVVAALVAVASTVFALVRAAGPADISEGAHWTVSSTAGMPSSGVLPERGPFWSPPAYFFHTNVEEFPRFTVDLGRTRIVQAVDILNRIDCCRERARPLRIEASVDGAVFVVVATREANSSDFESWRARVPRVPARFVRITGNPKAPMHFADVRIFGS